MDKDKVESAFDFDNDPDFNANFYKNIEKALGDSDILTAKEAELDKNDEITKPDEEQKLEAESAAAIPAETDELAASAQIVEEPEDTAIDDELIDINASLAKQISEEMDIAQSGVKTANKKHNLLKIQSGVVLALLCLAGFGFFFGFTKPGNHILMDMGINLGGFIWASTTNDFKDNTDVSQDIDYVDEEDSNPDAVEIDPSTVVWPNNTGEGRKEAGVYNILLLGEEAIGQGGGRGRTDEIVIATLNTNDNTLKLTSLMRDQLVRIPGFKDNKLNVAYEEGGIDLLYEVVALNFDVHLDGSVMVNFKNFETIVDELGGLEITLTAGEAKYLNTTNYISNKKYRTVHEGTQLMNGNQVLGYSRVRKRAAITGNNNDYGRTDRHRIVLNAIFEKCKSKSKAELASMMFKFLPMITTDIDDKNFEALLNAYIKTGATQIQQLRIPADNTFDDNAKVRGMSVLIPDYEKNIEILHSFIFGDESADSSADAAAGTDNGSAADAADNTGN